MINFRQPYFSKNLQEFWRRWHISLSTWLRDYLYIPLGGNRYGNWKTYRNLMLTMVIGGLWHGAAWTFVMWGFIHGLFLAITRWWRSAKIGSKLAKQFTIITPIVSVILTYHIVVFAWVFFRADSIDSGILYINRIITLNGESVISNQLFATTVTTFLLMLLIDLPQIYFNRQDFLLSFSSTTRAIFIGSLIVILIIGGAQTANDIPFIYFQF